MVFDTGQGVVPVHMKWEDSMGESAGEGWKDEEWGDRRRVSEEWEDGIRESEEWRKEDGRRMKV